VGTSIYMMRVHIEDFDKYCNENKNIIYIDMLTIILKREHKIKLRHNKLYRLKKINLISLTYSIFP